MASTVATPLERHLGAIADVDDMTSTSSVGTTNIQLTFGIDRDIDGAARDVQAAIVAAHADLPSALTRNPSYRKINSSQLSGDVARHDLGRAHAGPDLRCRRCRDLAAAVADQRRRRRQRQRQCAARRARRDQSAGAVQVRHRSAGRPRRHLQRQRQRARRARSSPTHCTTRSTPTTTRATRRRLPHPDHRQSQRRDGAPGRRRHRCSTCRMAPPRTSAPTASTTASRPCQVQVFQQPGANIIEVVDAVKAELPQLQRADRSEDRPGGDLRPLGHHPRLAASGGATLLLAVAMVILVVYMFLRSCARRADSRRGRAGLADRHLRRHVPARLQPRQLLADGAHHRHRLRGRRCDRGHGEHHAPHRGGHGAHARRRCWARARSASPCCP